MLQQQLDSRDYNRIQYPVVTLPDRPCLNTSIGKGWRVGKPALPVKGTTIGAVLLLCLVFTGCGIGSSPAPTTTAPELDPETTATVRPPRPPVPTAALAPTIPPEPYPAPVSLAITMAADETGVPRDQVRIVSYEEREWPSTALGCPQEGFSYHQVVTPGYFVRLEIEGEARTYHTNRATTVVNCTAGS